MWKRLINMITLELIGEGATTKVYRDGDKAVKLYTNIPFIQVENEAQMQSFSVEKGLPVPKVYGVREFGENMIALDMEYIHGKHLLHDNMNKDERYTAIQTLVKLQCAVHSINAEGLPKQCSNIIRKIERNKYIDKNVINSLLLYIESLNTKFTNLCHGDFHPLNIMFDGEKYWIIDWVDAVVGSPVADACRTYLIFKQFLLRYSGVYLRCFCKEAGVKEEDVLAWLPAVAAARMTENMDNKARTFLMKIINEWGLNQ